MEYKTHPGDPCHNIPPGGGIVVHTRSIDVKQADMQLINSSSSSYGNAQRHKVNTIRMFVSKLSFSSSQPASYLSSLLGGIVLKTPHFHFISKMDRPAGIILIKRFNVITNWQLLLLSPPLQTEQGRASYLH